MLRNALRPLVTILGLSFPAIFAGGVVIETVFGHPGMGWLAGRGTLPAGAVLAVIIVAGCFAGNALWPPDPAALHPADALKPVAPGYDVAVKRRLLARP